MKDKIISIIIKAFFLTTLFHQYWTHNIVKKMVNSKWWDFSFI